MVNRCTLFHVGSLFLLFCFVAFFPAFFAEPTLVVVQRWKKRGRRKTDDEDAFRWRCSHRWPQFFKMSRPLSELSGRHRSARKHPRKVYRLASRAAVVTTVARSRSAETENERNQTKKKYKKKSKQNGTKIKNRRENAEPREKGREKHARGKKRARYILL